ncbi:MAG: hypothetical protein A2Z95_00435 [Gallionellales bacterium GWA2_60_18]|nr:MAG: hypothetical protein A2Z95_00435 [Gallionellales bacterium GWA2_60_18]
MIALLASVLTACVPALPPPIAAENASVPADFPAARYRQAAALGKKILRVDTARSSIVIEVHRAGPLARLGHDHVVASHDVGGYVSGTEGVADLYVPLERLAVDEPELRHEAGLDTQPSAEDIAGTRRNMLNRTLDAGHFPYALVHVTQATAGSPALNVSVTLHGMTRTYEVPARIEAVAGGLIIDGRISLNQTDFGITPLAVLGGALQVQDRLDLRFHILANSD